MNGFGSGYVLTSCKEAKINCIGSALPSRNRAISCTPLFFPCCCQSSSQKMAEYQGLIMCNLSCELKVAASDSSFLERRAFTG